VPSAACGGAANMLFVIGANLIRNHKPVVIKGEVGCIQFFARSSNASCARSARCRPTAGLPIGSRALFIESSRQSMFMVDDALDAAASAVGPDTLTKDVARLEGQISAMGKTLEAERRRQIRMWQRSLNCKAISPSCRSAVRLAERRPPIQKRRPKSRFIARLLLCQKRPTPQRKRPSPSRDICSQIDADPTQRR